MAKPRKNPSNKAHSSGSRKLEIPEEIEKGMTAHLLFRYEMASDFKAIVLKVAKAIRPVDFVDWLHVEDIANCTWDISRARRAIRARLSLAKFRAIGAAFKATRDDGIGGMAHVMSGDTILSSALKAIQGNSKERAEFDAAMEKLDLEHEHLGDIAYAEERYNIEGLQKLIDNATSRRTAVLREVDRRRDTLSKQLREVLEEEDDDAPDGDLE